MKKRTTLPTQTAIEISQRIAAESLARIEGLDLDLADIFARVRASREAIEASRALLAQLQAPPPPGQDPENSN
jgi:Fic family protein